MLTSVCDIMADARISSEVRPTLISALCESMPPFVLLSRIVVILGGY